MVYRCIIHPPLSIELVPTPSATEYLENYPPCLPQRRSIPNAPLSLTAPPLPLLLGRRPTHLPGSDAHPCPRGDRPQLSGNAMHRQSHGTWRVPLGIAGGGAHIKFLRVVRGGSTRRTSGTAKPDGL